MAVPTTVCKSIRFGYNGFGVAIVNTVAPTSA